MRRLQLAVLYRDGQTHYFPVGRGRGWRVDSMSRQIVVGCGIPRTMIPFDNVLSYCIEEITNVE